MKRHAPVDAMEFPRFSGIRTFMRLPYTRDLEGVDFAVIGAPFDTGATFRVGARFGPEAIRSASVLLRPYNPAQEIVIFDYLSGIDYGDFSVVPGRRNTAKRGAQIRARRGHDCPERIDPPPVAVVQVATLKRNRREAS